MKTIPILWALTLSAAACASTPRTANGPSRQALTAALAADGRFTTLLKLIEASGVEVPNGEATVFAPTDAAFAKLSAETLQAGLAPAHREHLRTELAFHMAAEKVTSTALAERKTLDTSAGFPVQIEQKDRRLIVGNAIVTSADIVYDGGVIHAIDQVLRPPSQYLKRKPAKTKTSKRVHPDQWWW